VRTPSTALLFCTLAAHAQPRILHFTRTSGFDHNTRGVSYAMFQGIAPELAIVVDDDATGEPFSDPSALSQYSAIVFANTSGNAILNALQRANFEQWVANGGHVLGIHAATDTYRHSTANGTNTGTWDFYAELIGASVQENPNHVTGTPQYNMQHIGTHPSTTNLPDPWVKHEEYYYWEGGYYRPDNVEVLRVEGTIGPNGQVNSYDAPRPMSWYRELPNGSRVFCTALGHAPSNYTSDAVFRTHIKDALAWLLGGGAGIAAQPQPPFTLHPNPSTGPVMIVAPADSAGRTVVVMDASGREVFRSALRGERTSIDLGQLAPGHYVLRLGESVRPLVRE
jgi:type 1 glutamine amidotransferase